MDLCLCLSLCIVWSAPRLVMSVGLATSAMGTSSVGTILRLSTSLKLVVDEPAVSLHVYRVVYEEGALRVNNGDV